MKVTSARTGRVFILRLEDGDILHQAIEAVAAREGVAAGVCWFVGGADTGSRLVVGPEDGRAAEIRPMLLGLAGAHEALAVGTLFPDAGGRPVLHMHGAFGRGAEVRAGCVREGVRTWLIGEVVLLELLDCTATRQKDPQSGFTLLHIPNDETSGLTEPGTT